MLYFCCFFFFKQKTAYEMRISDWSSDVCSSDLKAHRRVQYHNREGEYANLDTEAERAKRRESGRQARGRYVWDEGWLKKRLIKTCTKCKIELPANPAWFRADTKNTTGLSKIGRAHV